MGLFSKIFTASEERRLGELEERLQELEREMKGLRLDWETTYDKVRHMMQRIAKRADKLHEEALEDGRLFPSEERVKANGEVRSATGGMLTPHQREVQQQILKRRARLEEG